MSLKTTSKQELKKIEKAVGFFNMSSDDIKNMNLIRWNMPKEKRFKLLKNIVQNHIEIDFPEIKVPDLSCAINRASLLCFTYHAIFGISPRNCSRYHYDIEFIEMAKLTETKKFIRSFCHEFTHHIQNLLYWDNNHPGDTFEDALSYEQEAGRFSYFIYKWFFEDSFPGIHSGQFKTYHSKYSINTLKETYDLYKENE